MNLISRLLTDTHFSPVESILVEYILAHRDEISQLSISELAKRTHTSNAAIIRLCHKLDLDGFRSFKIRFLTDLEKYRQTKPFIDINYPFAMHENALEVCQDLAQLTRHTIEACYQELQNDTLQKACQLLTQARQIYLFAVGDSAIRALSFKNKLLKIGLQAVDANQLGEGIVYASYATQQDCALFITYSSQGTSYLETARVLSKQQTPIVLITARPQTALALLADVVLTFPDLEDPQDSIATFYSQIAIDYILNVLYSLIYACDYQHHQQQKKRIDQIKGKREVK